MHGTATVLASRPKDHPKLDFATPNPTSRARGSVHTSAEPYDSNVLIPLIGIAPFRDHDGDDDSFSEI